MKFETERLLLRPWCEDDAEILYEYAKDPRVGPAAGWPVHTDVEDSRRIIRGVLSEEGTYAVILKETGLPVGSVGLTAMGETSAEIGYWIGVPHWGKGYIPEAVRLLLRYSFEELHLETVWCNYYDGNTKSRRVQEKCGFTFHHTIPDRECPLLGEIRIEHVNRLTREEWLQNKE